MQTLRLKVRPQLRPLVRPKTRFSVAVAHRRAGKTVAAVQRLIVSALGCERERPRTAYIAPTYKQAKAVAWDYLKEFARPVMEGDPHETELRVTLLNGSQVRLYGAENYDALRGIYLDDVVLDEYADMPPAVWPSVIRPALSDRKGSALFIGTPKGRNDFWRIYDDATRAPGWQAVKLAASVTGLLDEAELAAARQAMSDDLYQQEYECSFDAAVLGSYYGKLLDAAQTEGRICRVDYDPSLRVETWWDLGVSDPTSIWFVQRHRREVRLIDHLSATGEGLPFYAKALQGKPYVYSRHIGPHDIAVRELGSGTSRIEAAEKLGLRFEVAPNLGVDEGIEAVRLLLPRCWFDAEKCAKGLEALRQYRADYDERLKTFRSRPRHDWASHDADAFRTGAVMEEEFEPAPEAEASSAGGWMS